MILALYVARRFLRAFLMIAGVFLLILFLIDMIEIIRRFSGRDIGLGGAARLAGLNIAGSFYSILPLMTVLAGITLFLGLARSSEMVAIRAAAESVQNYRLPGSTLYVTLEPCSMCAGLIVHARIARVVFAASEPRAGVAISQGQFFDQGFLNHRVRVEGGLLAEESGALLKEFFKARRG